MLAEIRNPWLRRAAIVAVMPFVVLAWLLVALAEGCAAAWSILRDESRGPNSIAAHIGDAWRGKT